jgi:hypothetical protein
VDQHSRAFIGIDTSKLRNAVAVADESRDGEVRYLGEIDTTEAATRKLVAKLAGKYRQLTFCYEAGPTGYGLHRLIWEAWPRLHRGGPLAHPEETWRWGEDEPTRRGRPRQVIALRGTHRGLGARRAA